MFQKEFIERQKYLKENGPRTNFNFTNANYFPLKIEREGSLLEPIIYDPSFSFTETRILEFSI